MPRFEITSDLPIEPTKLYQELLTLKRLNRELASCLKISVPTLCASFGEIDFLIGSRLSGKQYEYR